MGMFLEINYCSIIEFKSTTYLLCRSKCTPALFAQKPGRRRSPYSFSALRKTCAGGVQRRVIRKTDQQLYVLRVQREAFPLENSLIREQSEWSELTGPMHRVHCSSNICIFYLRSFQLSGTKCTPHLHPLPQSTILFTSPLRIQHMRKQVHTVSYVANISEWVMQKV